MATHSCKDNVNEEELLPEDIQFQILLWLPVVSLLRFKSVCKSWCSHIQSSCFISQHKQKGKYFNCDQDSFIVLANNVDKGHVSVISEFEVSENLYMRQGFLDNNFVGEMECCDGIVLFLKYYPFNFTLWNPATRQFRLLPKTHIPLQDHYMSFGFGFDSNTDDYKVVKFICCDSENKFNNQVEVYSLNNDSWTSLDLALPIIYDGIVSKLGSPYPTNGTTYYCWVGYRDSMIYDENLRERVWEILSFDFTTQVFGTISLPNDSSFNKIVCAPYMKILRDKIACINISSSTDENLFNIIDVWVLNEFGAKESWTRQYRVGRPFYFVKLDAIFQYGIVFSKIGDSFLFFDFDDGQFWLFDLVTQERKRLPTIPDLTDHDEIQFVVYKESLQSVESRKECKPSSTYETSVDLFA